MKILKVLILSVLFFAGREAVAQNQIIVNNNNTTTYSLVFNFTSPCAPVSMTSVGPTSSSTSFCAGSSLVSFDISFTDNSCSPPQHHTVHMHFAGGQTAYTFTKCDGTLIQFNIHYNGLDYILDIN